MTTPASTAAQTALRYQTDGRTGWAPKVVDRDGAERAARALLAALGQDIDVEPFARAPAELVDAYERFLDQDGPEPDDIDVQVDERGELVVVSAGYLGFCPHLAVSRGVAHVGYLRSGCLLTPGVVCQMLVRLARQPQLPSALAAGTADWLSDASGSAGCVVVVESDSSCIAGCAGPAHRAREVDVAARGVFGEDRGLVGDVLAVVKGTRGLSPGSWWE